MSSLHTTAFCLCSDAMPTGRTNSPDQLPLIVTSLEKKDNVFVSKWFLRKIKVLCEQTHELADDLHDFLDYVQCYLVKGILWLIVLFKVQAENFMSSLHTTAFCLCSDAMPTGRTNSPDQLPLIVTSLEKKDNVFVSKWFLRKIKVLCEQTHELADDLHDFLDYVQCYLVKGILWLIVLFKVRAVVQCSLR